MLNLDKVKKRHQVKTGHNTKQKLMFKTKFKQYICATTISSVLGKKSCFSWTLFVLIQPDNELILKVLNLLFQYLEHDIDNYKLTQKSDSFTVHIFNMSSEKLPKLT